MSDLTLFDVRSDIIICQIWHFCMSDLAKKKSDLTFITVGSESDLTHIRHFQCRIWTRSGSYPTLSMSELIQIWFESVIVNVGTGSYRNENPQTSISKFANAWLISNVFPYRIIIVRTCVCIPHCQISWTTHTQTECIHATQYQSTTQQHHATPTIWKQHTPLSSRPSICATP